MTEDRDFKDAVRRRSAKTGESYQTARRQMKRRVLSAPVHAQWAHPAGLVLGCVVEQGQLALGMPVTLLSGDGGAVLHEGIVVSLRVGKEDKAVVASGECGILLDPPFHGYVSREIDETALQAGALTPVETVGLPYLVVG